ncbi:MAG: amidase family protein [Pseudolabrys sp.]|jgi:amidase|nr:amidase family protein [Pseudolabrys sp.]
MAMTLEQYREYDALDLSELVRRGDVSSAELTDCALKAIERLNPVLNAVAMVRRDAATAAVREADPDGPLYGVPFLLKDTSVSLSGVPTEYGSRYFKGYTRNYDSEIVRRYKKAGFAIIGKTNCSECGSSCSAENAANGRLHNPWDLKRIPGISSGGSAAAVAAGIVPAAHATDAGGSIRGPASWCGLVGLKPTRGRISYAPDAGEHWSGLGTQHVVSRSVRDSAAILDYTAGFIAGDPYSIDPPTQPYLAAVTRKPGRLRIGFATDWLDTKAFAEETRHAIIVTARLLEQLGHDIEEASPKWDAALMGEAMGSIAACALAELVIQREKEIGVSPTVETMERANLALLEQGSQLSAVQLAAALKKVNSVSRSFAAFFETRDIWLTPTMSDVAPLVGYLDSNTANVELLVKRFSELYRFNSIYNASGLPAISLPLHSSRDGLPIGMMFGAGFGKEGLLFQLAGQLEQALPWKDRHPFYGLWKDS